ncbi:hypothetical protein R1sor_024272 [Riccia sorocarpa]|uniref:Transferase n=1 Tax=Riccia sorocarpa TaxID=122646 RepID=A0ABD3GRX0_9MARC
MVKGAAAAAPACYNNIHQRRPWRSFSMSLDEWTSVSTYFSSQLLKEDYSSVGGIVCLLVCALSGLAVYRGYLGVSWVGRHVKSSCKEVRTGGSSPLPRLEDYLPPTGGGRVTQTFVKAKKQPVPKDHWMSLSNLDRVVNPTFSSLLLYYSGEEVKECDDISKRLIDSLADVLTEFFPLAGRLELKPDGLVDLRCNNQGAIFMEVSVPENLATFGNLKPQPALSGLNSHYVQRLRQKTQGNNLPGTYLPDQIEPMPVLIIQLTRFKCGSVSLGVNWHHTVADGSAGCHFVQSWAETAFGISEVDKKCMGIEKLSSELPGLKGEFEFISQKPNHDRTLLKPRNPPDPSLVNQNGYSTKVNPRDFVSAEEVEWKPAVVQPYFIAAEKLQDVVERVKQEAVKYPQYNVLKGEREYSRAECLSGLLWRAFTRSRYPNLTGPEDDRDPQTRFFMFVDGRAKPRLNLPKEYFGNVVCSACALTTEKTLLREPLIHAVYLIRKAVDGASGHYFRSLIDWVETMGLNSSHKSDHVNSKGQDVAATFWTSFPLYRMDFGWGQPAFAARNSPPREFIDGVSVMPSNTGNNKDMVALINLHEDRLERLLEEDTFRELVSIK